MIVRSDLEHIVTMLDVVEHLAVNNTITASQRLQLTRKATREIREIIKRADVEESEEEN
jgi:hypothetical protein